jgi:predicted MPP superfamily phosphohydrolase
MARVLVIGDLHLPVVHPGYLDFCRDLQRKWKTDTVVAIGDLVDWHSISFHPKNPNCPSANDEYENTRIQIRAWVKAFPKVFVTLGNHDERPGILAEDKGIPAKFLKTYAELWGTKGWKWDYDTIIDDVYYCHGTGQAGVHPAWNLAGKMLMSVVMGHCHSRAGIKWRVNPLRRIFAMDVGCGIDVKAFQFAYGRHCKDRPILAAGVVIDGNPYLEIMPIGSKEVYAKERYR